MDSASPSTSPSGYGMMEMELDAAVALADLATAGESRKQSVSPAQDDPARAVRKRDHNLLNFSSFQLLSFTSVLSSDIFLKGLFSSLSAAAADDRETEERFKHCSAMAGSSSVKLSAGRGTRQGSTEAEKEERRIRRVLANRESARQTIRRRQALRDELTKKVAYLRLENDTMKLEKESAMEEYLSLWHANAQLKEQIAHTARGEIDMNSATTEVESSACPTIVSVKPALHVPPCAWFQLLPGGECSLVPSHSETGAEKEARGDSQVKAAAAAAVDDKSKQTGCYQTPDKVLPTAAAAAAAEARKRRKELTKLKQHHAR